MNKLKPTEYSFVRYLDGCVMLQQEDLNLLSTMEGIPKSFHIYIICRRKTITIVPEKFKAENGIIYITHRFHNEDKYIEKELKFKHSENSDDFSIISDYPYKKYILNYKGKFYSEVKASLGIQQFYTQTIDELDLEVLYIGQAFGKNGERTANDRLISHSTLQKIYSEAINNNPDSDIFILLCNFSEASLFLMNGKGKYTPEEINTSDKKTNSAIKAMYYGIDEAQVINITEAALIKYFQPDYNINFKTIFPDLKHNTYSEFYKLDFNSICIEIDTLEPINCKLYTKTTERKSIHYKSFHLNKSSGSRDMFDLSFLE